MINDNKTNLKALFRVGDNVLCPSLSSSPFILTDDPYGKRDDLTLEFEGSYFYYDNAGYFVRASQKETDDFQPSLYRNTPVNQQAINTLYGNVSSTQSKQRKTIDTTDVDDNEVILMPSVMLSDTACDISGAITLLNDIGRTLYLIYQKETLPSQSSSMARLSHDSVDRWANQLSSRLEAINEPLVQSAFGVEVPS